VGTLASLRPGGEPMFWIHIDRQVDGTNDVA
jgi:hypothetical protein